MILVDGNDAGYITDELKARDIPVIIAVRRAAGSQHEAYDTEMSPPARLAAVGVKYCISDGGGGGAGHNAQLPYHAAMAAAYGLSRDEALKSVTLYPAQIFGVADKLGSIEVGKIADLFVADGDALDSATHVEQVYINGKATSMENRQTRLFKKYDARPRGPKARKR